MIDAKSLYRFQIKQGIADPQQCWEWRARRTDRGYGVFSYLGKSELAHRVAMMIEKGKTHPPPPHIEVCHSCDNPPCTNPSHLWLGTHTNNMRDMMAKGRHNTPVGSACLSAKLDEIQVLRIRKIYSTRFMTQRELALEFEVDLRLINLIVNRKAWVHI